MNQATLELIKGFEGWYQDICELVQIQVFDERCVNIRVLSRDGQMTIPTATRLSDGDISAMTRPARTSSIPSHYPRQMDRSCCWTIWL